MRLSNEEFDEIIRSKTGIVRAIGREVYACPIFEKGWQQVHHKGTTVAIHSEHVAVIALWLAEHTKKTVNEHDLVLGALCHDLGIIDRHEKFKSQMETFTRHPKDSVVIARALLGDKFNPTIEDMIRYHMWPLTRIIPKTVEGRIIVMADKICSAQETGRRMDIREKVFDKIMKTIEKAEHLR